MVPIVLASAIAAGAIALVAYLLWPTWGAGRFQRSGAAAGQRRRHAVQRADRGDAPMKIQRHSGPQERVDLGFVYPSLEPPERAEACQRRTVEDTVQPIDRIFLSIAAHHDSLAPDIARPHHLSALSRSDLDAGRGRLDDARVPRRHALWQRRSVLGRRRPSLTRAARAMRATPGMCLSERRIDGADLTFRFPRSWLAQWRDVAGAMERLTAQMRGPKG